LFHDSVEGDVRSLTLLGKPLDSYADDEIKKHFARECTNVEWTFQNLQDAIYREIRVLESVLTKPSPTSHMPTVSFHAGTRKFIAQQPTGESLYILLGLPCYYRL